MLAVLRDGSDEETAVGVVDTLKRRIAPDSIWDGLSVGPPSS